MEGDTPSFLNLINNGLTNPEHPDWGGWGGRYELYTPSMQKWFLYPETRPFGPMRTMKFWELIVVGTNGNHETIWRWSEAYQNDFAARMDWTIQPVDKANHPPVFKIENEQFH